MAKDVVKTADEKVSDSPKTTRAIVRYAHISPRKARLVANLLRGKNVAQAITQLQHLRLGASRPILKALQSAIASAEHNLKAKKELLSIDKILVNQGPVTARWSPRAYGRAAPIRRPTSHIEIVVVEGKEDKVGKRMIFPVIPKRPKKIKEEKREKDESKEAGAEEGIEAKREDFQKKAKGEEKGKRRGFFGWRRKLFNRKGGEK